MPKRGFTLFEVVLAVGITSAVLAILTTAIELFMVRVDTSRSRVESAQLARTLLTMIADDLQAARYSASPTASAEGETAAPTNSLENNDTQAMGIFGNETEQQIQRGAPWRWERLTRDLELDSSTLPDEMPQTVRYFLKDGSELLTDKFAASGVSENPMTNGYAGFYREQNVSSLQSTTSDTFSSFTQEQTAAELLAPEVVEIHFAYFDGEELLQQWDSTLSKGLPKAVEIRIKLLEEPFETAMASQRDDRKELRDNPENIKEYRLLVRLPNVRPPRVINKPASQNLPEF